MPASSLSHGKVLGSLQLAERGKRLCTIGSHTCSLAWIKLSIFFSFVCSIHQWSHHFLPATVHPLRHFMWPQFGDRGISLSSWLV